MSKKDDKMSLLKIFLKVFPLAFAACPSYWIITNLIAIIHGISYGLNTFMSAQLFDSVTLAVSMGTGAKAVIIKIMMLGIIIIGIQVLYGVHNFMNGNLYKIVYGHLIAKINAKAAKINPLAFENKEMLDDINKAGQGAGNSIGLLFTIITIFTFYLPYFLFMGGYLFSLKPILAVLIVLIFIPVMISQLIRSLVFTKFEDKAAPLRREFDYYETCICSREMFKETRLLGAFSFFKKLYNDSIALLAKETWQSEKKTGFLEVLMKVITLIGYGGVLFLLVDALLKKEISVGAFAAVFSSISALFGIMEEVICAHIGYMTKNLGTVKNFIRFLDLPEREGKDKMLDFSKGIEINNISFSYPFTEKPSIKNVTLKIKPGETLAIVGLNGAGKTTLIKLLTGLYLPDSGSITINGLNMKDIAPTRVYEDISGVFQHYGRYKMTLKENVKISNIEVNNNVETSLIDADIDVKSNTYPDGLDTMLAKEFDGVDISGGQWQRVAIGRGLYRNHEMIVLDEPTSAIDPIEETRIYKKFAELSKDVISIIVTHRLGSVKIADRIVVMDNGTIAEIGSHEELLENGGKYSEMWNAQAQYYV